MLQTEEYCHVLNVTRMGSAQKGYKNMSKETLCKHILLDKHRSMLGALGPDGIQTIKDAVSIEHTKAGKNMAPIVQSLAQFVVDHCKDLTLEGKYI